MLRLSLIIQTYSGWNLPNFRSFGYTPVFWEIIQHNRNMEHLLFLIQIITTLCHSKLVYPYGQICIILCRKTCIDQRESLCFRSTLPVHARFHTTVIWHSITLIRDYKKREIKDLVPLLATLNTSLTSSRTMARRVGNVSPVILELATLWSGCVARRVITEQPTASFGLTCGFSSSLLFHLHCCGVQLSYYIS